MATTSTTMRPTRRNQMILPDMWVTHYVTSRTGGETGKSYYINLRTRQTFHSKKALYRYFRSMPVKTPDCSCKAQYCIKRENDDGVCSLCEETGHSCTACPYPVVHKKNPFAGVKLRRCSRCHWIGHNARTCRQAPY